ncbi:hypothetical protein JXD20_04360 [Candidatus Peregrinibacteria bacterium]|nr:hypothetical protein [Candidatus Peregrinibacteria bacterium]
MTNRHASKQHGLSGVQTMQPKSKLRYRRNKAKAAIRKAERRGITEK